MIPSRKLFICFRTKSFGGFKIRCGDDLKVIFVLFSSLLLLVYLFLIFILYLQRMQVKIYD
jgi:hypothetical protein